MNKLKKYFENEILFGSIIIIALTFFGNFFSYLFQFLSARILGPEDYVIIAVLTSLIAIFGIPSSAIQTVISKNTTPLKMKKKYGKIKGMMISSIKKVLFVATIFFALYVLCSFFLSSLLGINRNYLILTGIFIFAAFLYPVMAGMAQGMKKFKDFGINFLINCFIKFLVGIGLIILGFRIYGAIIGFLSGMFIAFFVFFYSFKEVLKAKQEKYEIKLFSKENFYPLVAMIIFVLMFNLDVVFAKIFFNSSLAGQYSVASLIGKIILFVVSSIGTVMLPISSEKHISGQNTKNVLKKTLVLSVFVCLIGALGLFIFPKLIIGLLFGSKYASIYNILFYVGVAFSFLSLLNIFLLHSIATNNFRSKNTLILLMLFVIELLFFFFSPRTLNGFSLGFMASTILSAIGGYAIYRNETLNNNAHV